jgi:RNA polymerase sigma-70 factor (ECF subfamily)
MADRRIEKQETRSDEEVYLLSAEEPELFSVIFNRHVDGFVRRATYILGDKDEAKDAAQEAFIKLYGAASRYVPRRDVPFKSFAYRVLLNTCISIIRRRASRPIVPLSDSVEDVVADDASVEQFSEYVAHDWLSSLVARLPVLLAETVRRVIFSGKTTEEVAKEEGVSEGAVRVRLSRATKEIRKLAVSLEKVSPQ